MKRRNFVKKLSLGALSFDPYIFQGLSQVLGINSKDKRNLTHIIDHAFRLTRWDNLLNLEFYFINVDYKDNFLLKKRKVVVEYGQEESYMIVRLPQQHIAEESYDNSTKDNGNCVFTDSDSPKNWVATTRIAGYSYLVFKVIFPVGRNKDKIRVSERSLMSWDNYKRFQLVVKNNLQKSIFELKTKNPTTKRTSLENTYPFNYKLPDGGLATFDYDKFPKAAGDPITALEFPWRLILSPKLPDQDRFRFKWNFSKKIKPKLKKGQSIESELWFARLSIVDNPEYLKQLEIRKQYRKVVEEQNQTKVDEIVKELELMMIGSPDYPNPMAADKPFLENVDPHSKILPNAVDRKELVELYIKHKLVAMAENLTFSPLGVSTFIRFENTEPEVNNISLLKWKQLISLGRDEEVEIVRLMIDKEFGHKMLHIKSSKRRTKEGVSYLDYREYVMPLEVEKNYEAFNRGEHTQRSRVELNDQGKPQIKTNDATQFNTPFRKIRFTEVRPKRICPLPGNVNNPGIYKGWINEVVNTKVYYPLTFKDGAADPDKKVEPVTFEYEAEDWTNIDKNGQPKIVKLRKIIQAVPFSLVTDIRSFNANKATAAAKASAALKDVDDFFNNQEIRLQDLEKTILSETNSLKSKIEEIFQNSSDNFESAFSTYERFRAKALQWNPFLVRKKLDNLISKVDQIELDALGGINPADLKNKIAQQMHALFNDYQPPHAAKNAKSIKKYIENVIRETDLLEKEIGKINERLPGNLDLKKLFENELNKVKEVQNQIENRFNSIHSEIAKKVNKELDSLFKKWMEVKAIEKGLRNAIEIHQQQITYAVQDVEDQVNEAKNEIVSKLKTDFLLFKGEMRRRVEGELANLDFFNELAYMPQLEQAQVYVNQLDKIVNEEVPMQMQYAENYLKNQVDLARLEVEQNAARVFAEIKESSKEMLRGKIREVAEEMGGYINPEIPVEYLTYLKDPKKIPRELANELLNENPELRGQLNEIQGTYNDLVFIGKQAEKQWNEIKSIQPKQFFNGLKARILGSIDLAQILGLDFELPRLNQLPDKVVYNFNTNKIQNLDVGFIGFYANNKGTKSTLQIYMEKSLKKSNYLSFTRLANFTVAANVGGADVLTIFFDKFEIRSSHSRPKKTEIKIEDVAFGGPLDFLGKLAESFQIPGTGLRVIPTLNNINIGYSFELPSIETPSFNLANLKFEVGLNIPLPIQDDIKPLTATFGINRPGDKFLVSVGIFGGRGHFVLETTPEKLQSVDAAIEFGGYFGINLGIASGYVFLFAGMRFKYSGSGNIYFAGYLICGGGVTVFGFISVSVTFFLALEYQRAGGQATLYGTASVNYSVKIGFFKKSFTLSYSKRIAGSKGKRIDPDQQVASLIKREEEEVLYAYNGEGIMVSDSLLKQPDEELYEVVNDKKDFKTIYSRDIWKEYVSSFSF